MKYLLAIMIMCICLMILSCLSCFYLIGKRNEMSLGCFIFIGICLVIFLYCREKYQIFQYGIKGEKDIYKDLCRGLKSAIVLRNVHLLVDRKELEIDILVIDKEGVCIVEVKNYKGQLHGHLTDDYWIQKKRLKNGNMETKKVKNALYQLDRQKRLLASYLRQKKISCMIDGCVYIQVEKSDIQAISLIYEKEKLHQYILQRQGKPIDKWQMRKIKKVFK